MQITGAVLEEIGRDRPYGESQPIVVQELELSEPGSTELLVRMEAAGVCHSDLSVVNGSRVRPVPMLLGHEAAGIVEQVGDEVTDLEVGQRVVMTFLPRCGECKNCQTEGKLPCSVGSQTNNEGTLISGTRRLSRDGETVEHHLGVSGFATHAVVDRRSVVPVGDDVPPEIAAVFGCAVLTGGGALLNAVAPEAGESVMIVGLGGVGMAALLTAVAEGIDRIIAVDMSEEKLEQARQLGAHETYTSEEVKDQGITADHTLECAGHPSAFELAFSATNPGGRTVTAGLPSPDATSTITPLTLTSEVRTVMGSYLGSSVPSRDIPRFEKLWREGKLPVEKLITRHIRLDEINDAMDQLADGAAVRQIIDFSG
ncbi:alcohol dehydrogenase [Auritidibacter sp. NML130574]|uniref:alcohol dehydrogenase catalytic domain-containing protein n=1 Tax=Auritidibacter sp. NML130574 TaxID=2170745 RepID=UPI000D72A9A9|nr:alcohol dehydrogenase catalytic domain-containing protein [Auritidibacter sp. NML130574]AXR74643.1 alcohol dehydrogenase [Auritidibacter sp. NML130574]